MSLRVARSLPGGVKTVTTLAIALLMISAVPGGAMAHAVATGTADDTSTAVQPSIYDAETANQTDGNVTYVVNEDGDTSVSTSDQVDDKQAHVDERRASDGVSTMATTVTDRASDNVEGSTIQLYTEMDASFSSGVKATFDASGTSEATWYGTSPYYADEIKLTSTVGVDGVEVTVSYPPALSPGSGYAATVTNTFNDEWDVSHSYSGFSAESYVALYNGYQKDAATFQFGNSAYTLYTNANTDIA